jgi:vacuolar iron transporter family protein
VPHAACAAYRKAFSFLRPRPRHCHRHGGWPHGAICPRGGSFRRAVSSTAIIVTAGLAEIAAGAIAMGFGGYLAARTDLEHYESALQREIDEIAEVPETEHSEVRHILREHGLALAETLTAAITSDHQRWLDFMMRFELGLEKPEAGREFKSAMTISCAYIAEAFFRLCPMFFWTAFQALCRSRPR